MGYDVSHNPEERKTYILHTRRHIFYANMCGILNQNPTYRLFLVVAETTVPFSTAESFYPDQIKT